MFLFIGFLFNNTVVYDGLWKMSEYYLKKNSQWFKNI